MVRDRPLTGCSFLPSPSLSGGPRVSPGRKGCPAGPHPATASSRRGPSILDTHPVIFFWFREICPNFTPNRKCTSEFKFAREVRMMLCFPWAKKTGGSSGTRLALGCRADPHLRCLDYVPSVAAGWVRGWGVTNPTQKPPLLRNVAADGCR